MKKTKKNIIRLFNKIFYNLPKESKSRRLIIDENTGKINWSDGELPFGEGPDEKEITELMESNPILIEDDLDKRVRMFRATPAGYEVYRKNRFEVKFPGIQPHFFQAYSYIGTKEHSEKRLLGSDKVVQNEYSSFKILMILSGGFDICKKLTEIEESPMIGDIKVDLLDPVGIVVKTIVMPDCEVTEVKVFRDLDYGECGDKSDSLLFGEIVVKHKKRRLV